MILNFLKSIFSQIFTPFLNFQNARKLGFQVPCISAFFPSKFSIFWPDFFRARIPVFFVVFLSGGKLEQSIPYFLFILVQDSSDASEKAEDSEGDAGSVGAL